MIITITITTTTTSATTSITTNIAIDITTRTSRVSAEVTFGRAGPASSQPSL